MAARGGRILLHSSNILNVVRVKLLFKAGINNRVASISMCCIIEWIYWENAILFLQAGDRSLADVVAHEIAHSWTGNLVTNSTFQDFW